MVVTMYDEILSQKITANGSDRRFAHLRDKVRPYAKRVFDFCPAIVLIIVVLPAVCSIMLAIILGGQKPFYSHVRWDRADVRLAA
jgi:lipopolysaccharide/colanic/teichoic acid biosynthesis glycosyltransferase